MAEYLEIEVAKIGFGPAKIRRDIEENIEQLAESIKSEGILSPVLVWKTDDKYELVLGHRRFLAASKILGWTKVSALVVPAMNRADALIAVLADETHKIALTDDEMAEAAAEAVKELRGDYGAAAKRLGWEEDDVRRWAKYDGVWPEVKELVDQKKLGVDEAIRLMLLPRRRAIETAEEIDKRGLSRGDRRKAISGSKKYSAIDATSAIDAALRPPLEAELTLRFHETILLAISQAAEARTTTPEDLAEDIVKEWLRRAKYLPAR